MRIFFWMKVIAIFHCFFWMPGISINPFAARATTAGKHSCPCLNIFSPSFLHTFSFSHGPGYKSRQVIPVLQPSQLPQQPMTCNEQDRMCLEVDCRCVRIFPLSNFAPENSKILFLDRMFPSAKRAKAVILNMVFLFPRWRKCWEMCKMQCQHVIWENPMDPHPLALIGTCR